MDERVQVTHRTFRERLVGRQYPRKFKKVMLRETPEEGVYRQMEEVWLHYGEMVDGKVPAELERSRWTGRAFRRTRSVQALDGVDASPRPGESVRLLMPETPEWVWHFFEQIEGPDDPNPECLGFGPAVKEEG